MGERDKVNRKSTDTVLTDSGGVLGLVKGFICIECFFYFVYCNLFWFGFF